MLLWIPIYRKPLTGFVLRLYDTELVFVFEHRSFLGYKIFQRGGSLVVSGIFVGNRQQFWTVQRCDELAVICF